MYFLPPKVCAGHEAGSDWRRACRTSCRKSIRQRTTTAEYDDTSYTETPSGGRAVIVFSSTSAFIAESSAVPQITCVPVAPRVSVTFCGVVAAASET